MNKSCKRLGMMLLLGGCLQGAPLSAQAPVIPVQAPQGMTVEATESPTQNVQKLPTRGFFNNHGVGCYANHNMIGCGSCRSQFTFVFGSCRTFFGEPCIPNPGRGVLGSAGPGKCCGN